MFVFILLQSVTQQKKKRVKVAIHIFGCQKDVYELNVKMG